MIILFGSFYNVSSAAGTLTWLCLKMLCIRTLYPYRAVIFIVTAIRTKSYPSLHLKGNKTLVKDRDLYAPHLKQSQVRASTALH